MTALEVIHDFRYLEDKDELQRLTYSFAFKAIPKNEKYIQDDNLAFRTEIVEALLHNFSIVDINLIRSLFDEELKCEKDTQRHDNLYQLCFYLYRLGQLADSFILYDAKFNAKNMDVGLLLDRQLITVGHEIDEVINYVKAEFEINSKLKAEFYGILKELEDLKENPDYDDIESYTKFLDRYFRSSDNDTTPKAIENKAVVRKPWWRFG